MIKMTQDELLKINLLNQEIINSKETIDNLKNELDQLNIINTKTKEYLFIVENRNTHLENKVKILEKQVAEKDKLKKEITNLNNKVSLKVKEIDRLNNQKEELFKDIDEKKEEIKKLNEKLNFLNSDTPEDSKKSDSWSFKKLLNG